MIPCYMVPWFLLTLASCVGLGKLYGLVHPVAAFRILPDTIGSILISLGSLFAWLGPSMIMANLLVATVRPARAALDREAATVPGTDRVSANRDLVRLSRYLTPAGIVVALLGLIIPW